MAKGTSAYDLSLFETNTPRLRAVNSPEKTAAIKEKKERSARRSRMVSNVLFGLLMLTAVTMMIVFRVQHTEVSDRISNMEEQLAILQSETSRLTNELSAKMSAESVETFAKENGMEKVESYQIEYITVDGGDKIEVSDPAPEGVFETIGAAIAGWFGG